MPQRRSLTSAPAPEHDYQLEPPDEIIAELQSSVVRSCVAGELTRAQLVEALIDAARAVSGNTDPQHAVYVAALAIRLRMTPLPQSDPGGLNAPLGSN